MFSIILPLYNKGLYVEKALDSILNQSFQDFELIIVNDGSTDNGLEVAKNFLKRNEYNFTIILSTQATTVYQNSNHEPRTLKIPSIRERTTHHEPITTNPKAQITLLDQTNTGVSTARNNGVALAQNDYITFLDADDWWEPSFLEEMKTLIEKYPEGGIYGSSYYLVKNGRKNLATIGVDSDFLDGAIDYCKVYAKTMCMPLWTGAVAIPKHIFMEENGFKPNLKLGEDFDLWIRIALRKPTIFLNKALSNYNQDVELEWRAVGKLQKPATHMLWNLTYLEEIEKVNNDYKNLIDKLRNYSLYPYFLSNRFNKEAIIELNKVDWANFSKDDYNRYFSSSRFSQIIIYWIKKNIVQIKNRLLK